MATIGRSAVTFELGKTARVSPAASSGTPAAGGGLLGLGPVPGCDYVSLPTVAACRGLGLNREDTDRELCNLGMPACSDATWNAADGG
jgi:hypothetical protein